VSPDQCRHLWQYDEELCRVECHQCGTYVPAAPGYADLMAEAKAEALENARRRVLPPPAGMRENLEERRARECRLAILRLERTERARGRAS
jgi:hypothetical protein